MFKDCLTPKITKLYQNDLLQLLPTDPGTGDGSLQVSLMTRFKDCMKDRVSLLAENLRYSKQYSEFIAKKLGERMRVRRETTNMTNPSCLDFVRARAKDRTIQILEKENPSKGKIASCTYERMKRRKKACKRRRTGERHACAVQLVCDIHFF